MAAPNATATTQTDDLEVFLNDLGNQLSPGVQQQQHQQQFDFHHQQQYELQQHHQQAHLQDMHMRQQQQTQFAPADIFMGDQQQHFSLDGAQQQQEQQVDQHQHQRQHQQQQHQQHRLYQHPQPQPHQQQQQHDTRQWAIPLPLSQPQESSQPQQHQAVPMDTVGGTSNQQVDSMFNNQSFQQFRQSSLDYNNLISPYITGDMTALMQQDELDLLLTPLISPAMTPGVDFQQLSLSQLNENFSPLTSPALRPQEALDYSTAFMNTFSSLDESTNANENHTIPSTQHSISPSSSIPYTQSPGLHPISNSATNLGIAVQSPAMTPLHNPLRTSLVGLSPALMPIEMTRTPSSAGSGSGPRRRESLQSPLLSALRDKTKKMPLSSPYVVPRRKSGVLISPALMPMPNARSIRSSKSPDTVAMPNTVATTTPPSTIETGPVFKEPYQIKIKKSVPSPSSSVSSSAMPPSLIEAVTSALLTSPPCAPQGSRSSLAPITPAQLMQLDNAHLSSNDTPVSIQPASGQSLISPPLKPLLPNGANKNKDAAIRLTEKSNYQNMREGNTETIGLNYDGDVTTTVEAKRDCHKQAEQRRRDSLKQCFEELRTMLPPIEDKNPSKVLVLKKSCEYIHELQNREKDTAALLEKLRKQLAAREG
ncbi:hypothetical protein DFJ77DRAFT_226034 [Powellomyces hirtus]|nr:hypothetical protein DFJ77DRAFT_226034 [Powellomyces hirtus]